MAVKNICCIGAGLMGGALSSVLALKCPELQVHVIDQDEEIIRHWNSKRIPVYEPELDEIVFECRGRNLFFTSDVSLLVKADVIFVCSKAISKFNSQTEMKDLEDGFHLIVKTVNLPKIVIQKNVVPTLSGFNTLKVLNPIIEELYKNFIFIPSPELLICGQVVKDLLYPKKVLLGSQNVEAIYKLYEHWVPRSKMITADLWSAELVNLVWGVFMAQIITSINSITELCEATNTDICKLAEAVAMDSRLGVPDLKNYVGFKGLSYLKNIDYIINLCNRLRLSRVKAGWEKVLEENENQKQRFVARIEKAFFYSIKDRKMALLGFSQNSAAIYVSKYLLEKGVNLKICDPIIPVEMIMDDLQDVFEEPSQAKKDHIEIFRDPYDTVREAEAIVICADWPELEALNFHKIFEDMVKPAHIFDGNYILQHKSLVEIGFEVHSLGEVVSREPDLQY